MKTPPFTLGLLFIVGCDDQDDHDHGHEHAEVHPSPAAPSPSQTAPRSADAQPQPQPQPLGSHQARLEITDAGLRLVLTDTSSDTVPPAGEARVVLVGTGEEEQRLVLQPDGQGWSSPARVHGASGYVALISLVVADHTETARFVWGDVPPPAPAPDRTTPATDDHGDEHGHGHGH